MPPPSKTSTASRATGTGTGTATASAPQSSRTPGRRENSHMPDYWPWDVMYPQEGSKSQSAQARRPASKSSPAIPAAKPDDSKKTQRHKQPEGHNQPTSSTSLTLKTQNTGPLEGATKSPASSLSPSSKPDITINNPFAATADSPVSPCLSVYPEQPIARKEVAAARSVPAISRYAVGQVDKPLPACPVDIQHWTDDQPRDRYPPERSVAGPVRQPVTNSPGAVIEFTGVSSSVEGLEKGILSRLRYTEPNRQTGRCDFDLCLTNPALDLRTGMYESKVIVVEEGHSKRQLAIVHWGRGPGETLRSAKVDRETFLFVGSPIEVKQLFRNVTPDRPSEASQFEIRLDNFPGARVRTPHDGYGMKWFWDCTIRKLEARHELSLKRERSGGERETVLVVTKGPTQTRFQHQFKTGPFTDREWSVGFGSGNQSKFDEFRDFLSLVLLFPALLWNGALENTTDSDRS